MAAVAVAVTAVAAVAVAVAAVAAVAVAVATVAAVAAIAAIAWSTVAVATVATVAVGWVSIAVAVGVAGSGGRVVDVLDLGLGSGGVDVSDWGWSAGSGSGSWCWLVEDDDAGLLRWLVAIFAVVVSGELDLGLKVGSAGDSDNGCKDSGFEHFCFLLLRKKKYTPLKYSFANEVLLMFKTKILKFCFNEN